MLMPDITSAGEPGASDMIGGLMTSVGIGGGFGARSTRVTTAVMKAATASIMTLRFGISDEISRGIITRKICQQVGDRNMLSERGLSNS
ncbi:hypothetical protein N7457_003654 [Penicillium paradoxum]|uniref:uncharacterized protein n=1 Tax=Penicillium paradoxum TaxID=176176 RepID=UPI00254699C3|nr:uncharacterized protein N7457_003654 [Penicillium paradoxum]KAJ5788664.1 hypothetical protein N7457_003654 [Penicillium paradoxum]